MFPLARALVRQEGSYFPPDFPEEGRRVFRRNFFGNIIDGGFYTFGVTLVSTDAILPALLASLGAPTGLIGFAPQLFVIGFSLPPLFTAHYVATLPRMQAWVAKLGLWQRLPYLVAGLVLLAGDFLPRAFVIAIVFLTPLASALVGGVGIGAWHTFVARCFPPRRRPSIMSARHSLGAVLGLTSGAIVAAVLARAPAPQSYGILHLIAFAGLMVGLLGFRGMREPELDYPVAPRRSLRQSLPEYFEVFSQDRTLRAFLFARISSAGAGLLTPFIAIHALAVTGAGPALLGRIMLAAVAGRIFGTLFATWLGDHFGGRLLSRTGLLLMLAAYACVPFAGHEAVFLGVFALAGMGLFLDQMGSHTLLLDIAPQPLLAAYVSIQSVCMLPFLLVIGTLAGATYTLGRQFDFGGGILLNTVLAMAGLLVGALLIGRVRPGVHSGAGPLGHGAPK
jgi:MFS family permease